MFNVHFRCDKPLHKSLIVSRTSATPWPASKLTDHHLPFTEMTTRLIMPLATRNPHEILMCGRHPLPLNTSTASAFCIHNLCLLAIVFWCIHSLFTNLVSRPSPNIRGGRPAPKRNEPSRNRPGGASKPSNDPRGARRPSNQDRGHGGRAEHRDRGDRGKDKGGKKVEF